MNEKFEKSIFEDLLPLYQEGLLSEETAEWMERKAQNDEELNQLLELSAYSLPQPAIESPIESNKMFQKINRKLAMYQIIFVALSFLFAINTSMLNESFAFILWYTVLGFVTFLFYKDMKIVFYIAFIPIFFWSIGSNIWSYVNGHFMDGVPLYRLITDSLLGSIFISVIHFVFAVIGSVVAFLVLKIKERD